VSCVANTEFEAAGNGANAGVGTVARISTGVGAGVGRGNGAAFPKQQASRIGDRRRLEVDPIEVLASSTDGSSWFSTEDPFSPYYWIQDLDGNSLYYSGTYCPNGNRRRLIDIVAGPGAGEVVRGEKEGYCPGALPSGTYLFRVTGFYSPRASTTTWQFCNTKGSAMQELVFKIAYPSNRRHPEGGANGLICTPIKLSTLDQVCAGYDPATILANRDVVLEGSLHLGGLNMRELSAKDRVVLSSAISQEFGEASADAVQDEDVTILSWEVLAPEHASHRSLGDAEGAVGVLSFQVKVSASKLGAHSNDREALEEMARRVHQYLSQSMSSGLFVAKVATKARAFESKISVNYARLLNLNVIHKSEVNKTMSGLATTVVSLVALVGIILSVMFLVKLSGSGRSYAPVDFAESCHGSSPCVTDTNLQHGLDPPGVTAESDE